MLKKIIGTAGTRILNAIFNLVILLLVAKKIGSEGLGVIGLVIIDITVIQLVVDLVAGSAIIYFASRTNIGKLLLPAYIWIGFVILFFFALAQISSFLFPDIYSIAVPEGYELSIFAIALLSGLMTTHYNLLLGKEKIKTYNLIFVLQISVFLAVFLFRLIYLGDATPGAYFASMFLAYAIAAIISFVAVIKISKPIIFKGWRKITIQVIRYGFITQIANILNIGNKRFSFYFVRYFLGFQSLGVYNAGIQLTEGLRIIGQSIALVQFSTISNSKDMVYAKILTIRLMKFSVLLTLLAVLILIAIPENIYTLLLSKDFMHIKPVIIALSPGVIALVINNIYSHYFSGTGRPKVNLWSNVVGFVFTIILAFILIPAFGIVGASITASVSYISTVIYQYYAFKLETGTRFAEWIPNQKDFKDFNYLLNELRK